MFRKVLLVGMILLVGRGSVAQLSTALLISFGFFALQMKTWPCKNNPTAASPIIIVIVVIISSSSSCSRCHHGLTTSWW
jgi:hypothetical protein